MHTDDFRLFRRANRFPCATRFQATHKSESKHVPAGHNVRYVLRSHSSRLIARLIPGSQPPVQTSESIPAVCTMHRLFYATIFYFAFGSGTTTSNPQKARILFTTSPVLSHLKGSLDLANELKRRGYESISFALPDDEIARRTVEREGFKMHGLGSYDRRRLENIFTNMSRATSLYEQVYLFGLITNEQLNRHGGPFDELLSSVEFDLIVADYFAPMDAVASATKRDVPLVEFHTAVPLDDVFLQDVQLYGYFDNSTSFVKRLGRALRFVASAVTSVCVLWSRGVAFNHLLMQRPPHRYAIHFSFPGFRYPGSVRFPATTVNVGFSVDVFRSSDVTAATDLELREWLDKNDKVIYVSFGVLVRPYFEVLAAIVRGALASVKNARVLVSTRDRADLEKMLGRADNVRLENWVNQQMVLMHRSTVAFVTHGGPRSLGEAMTSRVPVLVVPHYGDQLLHGCLVERYGLGLQLHKTNVSLDFVRDRLVTILARREEMQENLEQMDRLRVLSGGVGRGADLIELVLIADSDNIIPYGADLQFLAAWNVDVWLFFSVCLYVGIRLILTLGRRLRRENEKSKKD